jgi:hypothetical protein
MRDLERKKKSNLKPPYKRIIQRPEQRIESYDLNPDLLYVSRQITFKNPTKLRQALPNHWTLLRFHNVPPKAYRFNLNLDAHQLWLIPASLCRPIH